MAIDDANLVRKCLKGDLDAIQELVRRHQDVVYALSLKMLRHVQDAEDVTQESMFRVFRSLHRWDPNRPLRPWIIGITVNRCRTALAKRVQQPGTLPFLEETLAARPPDDSKELSQEIRQALTQLRPEYREVFTLYHELGQPYDEIAEALDRPVGTIKTWLHRARLEMLDFLRQRGMIVWNSKDS